MILCRLSLGSGDELRRLAGANFLEKSGLWLAIGSLLFGLAGLKTASGILAARRWAWPLSLVMGIVLVGLFPLGTIFGLKLLFDLFNREVKEWFLTAGQVRTAGPETGPEYRGTNPELNPPVRRTSDEKEKINLLHLPFCIFPDRSQDTKKQGGRPD